MKKSLFAAIALLASIALLSPVDSYAGDSGPKREFRGAWLHIVGNQKMKTMSSEEIQVWFTSTLDILKAAGCNAVIFQVRPQADAFYPSELEPWTRFLTGEQGKSPSPYWDPLQFMIDECHERGMELHAWLNPYRVTSNEEEELCPDHMFYSNPSIFLRYGKQLYFDPAEPESVRHAVSVISDIVGRYDVDAIHFDDYFYPYPVAGQDFPDTASFRRYAAQQGYTEATRDDWRRNNVETLIRTASRRIRSIKPWVRFGISPFGIHRNDYQTPDGSGSHTNGLSNYHELFADVPAWAEKGYIDYIVPQLYWPIGHKRADYETLINWWNDADYKGQLYIGQSISTLTAADLVNPSTTQLARKMELVRDLPNVDGNVWWPGWSLAEGAGHIVDSLGTRYQSSLALIPAYTDLDSQCPDPVSGLKVSGGRLSWKVPVTDDPMQEAVRFVIYRSKGGSMPDITDPANILDITPDCKYDIPVGKGYSYTVTALDRCWNESAACNPVTF